MSDRPIGLGKVAENGTLNENGAFYSVQDINVLLENGGGSSGGDLPTPTVADAGKAVVVDEEGKYALGEAGGGDLPTPTVADAGKAVLVDEEGEYSLGEAGGGLVVNIETDVVNDKTVLDKTYNEIKTALLNGDNITFLEAGDSPFGYMAEKYSLKNIQANVGETEFIVMLYTLAHGGQDWGIIVDSYSSTSADGVLTLVEGAN